VRILNPERVIKHVDGDYDPPSETLPDNHCYCGWYTATASNSDAFTRILDAAQPRLAVRLRRVRCGGPRSRRPDAPPLSPTMAAGQDESDWSPNLIQGAQTGKFHYMWFDTQHTLEDWVSVSQRHQAWPPGCLRSVSVATTAWSVSPSTCSSTPSHRVG